MYVRCTARSLQASECMAPELAAHHFFMLASSSGVAFGHLLAQSSSVVTQVIRPLRTIPPPPPPPPPLPLLLLLLRESGTSLGRPCDGNWRADAHESSNTNCARSVASRARARKLPDEIKRVSAPTRRPATLLSPGIAIP